MCPPILTGGSPRPPPLGGANGLGVKGRRCCGEGDLVSKFNCAAVVFYSAHEAV